MEHRARRGERNRPVNQAVTSNPKRALRAAIDAAHAAGALMRRNLSLPKKINSSELHDIKLELDVRCQKLIERKLRQAFPGVAFLGEEGIQGDPLSTDRWVVDPIDGTVNFTYGIPHACVSIAFQRRNESTGTDPHPDAPFQTMVGVVYDPFTDETYTAIRGERAKMNGK